MKSHTRLIRKVLHIRDEKKDIKKMETLSEKIMTKACELESRKDCENGKSFFLSIKNNTKGIIKTIIDMEMNGLEATTRQKNALNNMYEALLKWER